MTPHRHIKQSEVFRELGLVKSEDLLLVFVNCIAKLIALVIRCILLIYLFLFSFIFIPNIVLIN